LVVKAEVADDAGASVVLRDDSKWGNAQMGQLGNCRVREDSPKFLLDEVDHFLLEKVKKFIAGCVGSPGNSSTDLLGRPGGSGKMHGGPVNGVVLEQTAGGVIDLLKVGEVRRGSKRPDVARKIWGGSETVNSIVN
jgi:hypothetical protein